MPVGHDDLVAGGERANHVEASSGDDVEVRHGLDEHLSGADHAFAAVRGDARQLRRGQHGEHRLVADIERCDGGDDRCERGGFEVGHERKPPGEAVPWPASVA